MDIWSGPGPGILVETGKTDIESTRKAPAKAGAFFLEEVVSASASVSWEQATRGASVTVGDGAAGSGCQISSDQLSATDTGTGTDNFV
jgi:hypothetical protein